MSAYVRLWVNFKQINDEIWLKMPATQISTRTKTVQEHSSPSICEMMHFYYEPSK